MAYPGNFGRLISPLRQRRQKLSTLRALPQPYRGLPVFQARLGGPKQQKRSRWGITPSRRYPYRPTSGPWGIPY